MSASPLKGMNGAAETVFRRQISLPGMDTLASTRTTMASVGKPPYLTYGYGPLAYTRYLAEGAAVVSDPASGAWRVVDLVRHTSRRGRVNR
jgi:hypothetical protein